MSYHFWGLDTLKDGGLQDQWSTKCWWKVLSKEKNIGECMVKQRNYKIRCSNLYLVGGLEHFLFSHILGIIIIFFRGVQTTNQYMLFGCIAIFLHCTRLPFAPHPQTPPWRAALWRSHLLPETCHRILFVRPPMKTTNSRNAWTWDVPGSGRMTHFTVSSFKQGLESPRTDES